MNHGGAITTGEPTVLIGKKPAARATIDVAPCPIPFHSPPPQLIVQGSPTVNIGYKPAARKGDKGACGYAIAMGCPTVIIGGGGAGFAPACGQLPAAVQSSLVVVGIAGVLTAAKAQAPSGAQVGAAMVGGITGGGLFDFVGNAAFHHDPSKNIETVAAEAGSVAGAAAGATVVSGPGVPGAQAAATKTATGLTGEDGSLAKVCPSPAARRLEAVMGAATGAWVGAAVVTAK